MCFSNTQTITSMHSDMRQYLVLVLKTQLASIPITPLTVPLLGFQWHISCFSKISDLSEIKSALTSVSQRTTSCSSNVFHWRAGLSLSHYTCSQSLRVWNFLRCQQWVISEYNEAIYPSTLQSVPDPSGCVRISSSSLLMSPKEKWVNSGCKQHLLMGWVS